MRCLLWGALLGSASAFACGGDGGNTDSDMFSDSSEPTSASEGSGSGSTTDTSASGTSADTGDSGDTSDSGEADTAGDTNGDGPLLDVEDTEGPTTTGGDSGTEEGCQKVDLLFVVDDSASMSEEQDKLTNAFPSFMETIDQELVQEKGIDYRVGVISAEMAGPGMCILGLCADGHRGRLQHQADRLNCQADEPAGRWIETGPVDQVSAEFTCIASMEGQDFREMPMEAARAALTDRVFDAEAYNAGFLRPDALLVMVILSDEDDQSVWEVPEMWAILNPLEPGPTAPVSDYFNMYVDLKGGEAERLVVIAISGDENADCGPSDDPLSTASPRIHELLSLAEPNSYWTQICENDYTAPLQAALDVISASCDSFPPVD